MAEKILVTGGCGFIGANLVPRLLDEGHQVRVVDNLSRGYRSFLDGLDVELIEADIRDRPAMDEAMEGIEKVVHLAAYGSVIESLEDPALNFDVNGRGTLTVLSAASDAGVKKLVFASTGGALVGDAEPPVSESSVPRPKSPYGASKLTGEAYCQAFAKSLNLATVMLRFANIYGPISAHKKGAVTTFSKAILKDEPIVIYGDGSATRDFLHVDDLCQGIARALAADLEPATVLHLATGRETSVRELADVLRTAADKSDHPIEHRPARPGEVYRNFANYDLAYEKIGFQPTVELEDGLRRMWRWFVEQGDEVFAIQATDS